MRNLHLLLSLASGIISVNFKKGEEEESRGAIFSSYLLKRGKEMLPTSEKKCCMPVSL